MKPIISTSQKTQKYLELPDYDFRTRRGTPVHVYCQFGAAKLNKQRPRIVVNTLASLKQTRNKPNAQQMLHEAGLKVPYFMSNVGEAIEFMERENKPIVGKMYNHSRGRGIRKFETPDELRASQDELTRYYFQEFVEANREWRVHVSRWQDEEVVAYRKCLRPDLLQHIRDNDLPRPWVRNIENCYFKYDGVEEDKAPHWNEVIRQCKQAIEVLGLDIAGVDVGENTRDGTLDFWIFEVNSASAMEEFTRERYIQALDVIIRNKAQRKGVI